MKSYKILLLFLILNTSCKADYTPIQTVDSTRQRHWVDSLYQRLSTEEKIGQLLMVAAYSNKGKAHIADISALIKKYGIGGLIFFQGGPSRQLKLTNTYQQLSKVPLLIGIDAEWGLGMRLDSTYSYPWNMTLGAVTDNRLIEKTGEQIGKHCRRLGVHINFAPVVDINTNPKNPIIGNRSYGENKVNVTEKALSFIKGMQSQGVMGCIKHFPGHGDTETDSHNTLPVVPFDAQRLDSVELYPFKKLFKQGVAGVMTAHLSVPALDDNPKLPSSLSHKIVTGIIKQRENYNGLIFTDALNMKGVANYGDPGSVSLEAFKAGNDVLLFPEDVPAAVSKISEAVKKGSITEKRLASSVKKILAAKYRAGLNQYKPKLLDHLYTDLASTTDAVLQNKLIENSLTLVKNDKALIPVKDLEKQKIAYVKLGDAENDSFLESLRKYAEITVVTAESNRRLLRKLKKYNLVIVGFHKSDKNPWKSYAFKPNELTLLRKIAKKKNVILNVFTSPYSLLQLPEFRNIETILLSYQNKAPVQNISAQLIFGAIGARGKLPVSVGKSYPAGYGIETKPLGRLGYALPEDVGMRSEKLKKIDSLVQMAIDSAMTPGAVVLVGRKGKVVYQKAFGYHTYAKKHKVKNTDLYDLASLTKIIASLPLAMDQVERGIIGLDTELGSMLPQLKGSDKEKISLKEALSHFARLEPWIPFYKQTVDSTGRPLSKYYRRKPERKFQLKVANDIYLRTDYRDSIPRIIAQSDLLEKKEYQYSDLPFYILKYYFDRYYGMPMSTVVTTKFYKPLGAGTLTYNPLEKFPKERIVPTELDDYYRHQLIHGYVHDMGAAMQNGIGGHAGLFGNANDVAKVMQLYLWGGYYGGHHYLKKETVDMFNTSYYRDQHNRRGVGFDKPDTEEENITCDLASISSFGHSGFTGTYTWADPEKDILYVFLSNRIYPTMQNDKLITHNIRTEILQHIYEAIED